MISSTGLAHQIKVFERRLLAWHKEDAVSQRLATIPGVGLISATALAASVKDPTLFRSGREFAAFLGLVSRQNSSGGKDRLGRISKMGDGYLRKLLVVGATSMIRRAKTDDLAAAPWIRSLLERKPARVVTVALANKTARIVWAVLARGDVYRPATVGRQVSGTEAYHRPSEGCLPVGAFGLTEPVRSNLRDWTVNDHSAGNKISEG